MFVEINNAIHFVCHKNEIIIDKKDLDNILHVENSRHSSKEMFSDVIL